MIRSVGMYFRTTGFTGLLYAIKGKALKSTTFFELKRKDFIHPFWLRVPSSDVRTYETVFIDEEYDCLAEKKPRTIVDAGANIGLASIYFANRFPDATIIAIEPEHSNFALLSKNVAPYRNVVPLQAALWNENGEINLVDPGLGKWGFMTESKQSSTECPSNTGQTVAAVTVDKIMEDYGLEKIDILKVDIEGAEREVFGNTSSWIQKVDSIIIELHERMKAGCNRSFYGGSSGFDNEWQQGENVFLSRENRLTKREVRASQSVPPNN